MQLMKSKKGFNLSEMPNVVITLMIIAIVLSLSAIVLTGMQTGLTANSYAKNATVEGLKANDTFVGYLDTIALVCDA